MGPFYTSASLIRTPFANVSGSVRLRASAPDCGLDSNQSWTTWTAEAIRNVLCDCNGLARCAYFVEIGLLESFADGGEELLELGRVVADGLVRDLAGAIDHVGARDKFLSV